MASKNKLIGSGMFDDDPAPLVEEVGTVLITPILMYSASCMQGKVVKTTTELKKLVEAGWKNHPGKVVCLPGHEKLWQKENEDKPE